MPVQVRAEAHKDKRSPLAAKIAALGRRELAAGRARARSKLSPPWIAKKYRCTRLASIPMLSCSCVGPQGPSALAQRVRWLYGGWSLRIRGISRLCVRPIQDYIRMNL